MFRELFPMLTVGDLRRSVAFYRDLLGCTETYRFPDDGETVFVVVELGPSKLGLGIDPDGDVPVADTDSVALCVYADDCDEGVERLRAAGVPILEEPRDQPWGERMARVSDPDGYQVVVASRDDST